MIYMSIFTCTVVPAQKISYEHMFTYTFTYASTYINAYIHA
jgi:hypothetical protein